MRSHIVTLGWLALAGCSSEADSAPAVVPLCDGSSNLTLRIFFSGGGQEYPGSEVRRENGLPSLAVDGQCRYLMSGGWYEQKQSRDLGWRQGTLPDDLRRTLERAASVEDLTEMYACAGFGGFDAPTTVISNARSILTCGGNSEPVLQLLTLIHRRAAELWAAAQPLDGGFHLSLVPPFGSEPPRWYEWPVGRSLPEYYEPGAALDAFHPKGRRQLVPAADAAPLRAIREQYLRDTEPGILYQGGGIPVSDGQRSGMLFMRDALPYEDELGLLPLRGE